MLRQTIFKASALLLLGTIGISHSVSAQDIQPPSSLTKDHFYITGSGGIIWEKLSNNSLVDVGSSDNLYRGKHHSTGPYLGLSAGYHWQFKHTMFELGLEADYSRTNVAQGTVYPYYPLVPNYDTLHYNAQVESFPILAVIKFGLSDYVLKPYVTAGVGMAWNRAQNYSEVPTDSGSSAMPMRTMFQAKTQADFSYMVGAGIAYALTPSTTISLEYRYLELGKVGLDSPVDNGSPLDLGKLRANLALLNITVALP